MTLDARVLDQKRNALQRRIDHVVRQRAPHRFRVATAQLLVWLNKEPFFSACVSGLKPTHQRFRESLETHIAKHGSDAEAHQRLPSASDYEEEAALAHAALVTSVQPGDGGAYAPLQRAMMLLGHVTRDGRPVDEVLRILRVEAISVLHGYLSERIDSVGVTVALLERYRQRVELFHRETIRRAAYEGAKSREVGAVLDLFRYLHEEGFDYQVEPLVSVGRPDMLVKVLSEQLVIEAKFVSSDQADSEVRAQVARGVRQVVEYAKSQGQPVGHLVVFLDQAVHLTVGTPGEVGFVLVGGIGVRIVVVDVHEHSTTASNRQKMPVVHVRDEDLVAHP